jgi:hypothetical protein
MPLVSIGYAPSDQLYLNNNGPRRELHATAIALKDIVANRLTTDKNKLGLQNVKMRFYERDAPDDDTEPGLLVEIKHFHSPELEEDLQERSQKIVDGIAALYRLHPGRVNVLVELVTSAAWAENALSTPPNPIGAA